MVRKGKCCIQPYLLKGNCGILEW